MTRDGNLLHSSAQHLHTAAGSRCSRNARLTPDGAAQNYIPKQYLLAAELRGGCSLHMIGGQVQVLPRARIQARKETRLKDGDMENEALNASESDPCWQLNRVPRAAWHPSRS